MPKDAPRSTKVDVPQRPISTGKGAYNPVLLPKEQRLDATVDQAKHQPSMLGDAHADKPLWQRLNYIHVAILTFVPLASLYALFFVPLQWKTALFAVAYYFFTGFGITAGEFSCLQLIVIIETNGMGCPKLLRCLHKLPLGSRMCPRGCMTIRP